MNFYFPFNALLDFVEKSRVKRAGFSKNSGRTCHMNYNEKNGLPGIWLLFHHSLRPHTTALSECVSYPGSSDGSAVPLMRVPSCSIENLRPELLEEVKDVLIPEEQLIMQKDQIIGKGEHWEGCTVSPSHTMQSFVSSFYSVCWTLPLKLIPQWALQRFCHPDCPTANA